MARKNTPDSYGSVAKWFHWFMAVIIFGLIVAGLTMEALPNGPFKFKIFGLHKSFGITILMLAFFRLFWKMKNKAPTLPDSLNNVEKCLAHLGHGALYFLMFSLPLSGWMMSSAAGFPVSVFGLFTLPNLVAPDPRTKAEFIEIHENMAWLLIGLLVLHIAAALMHHFYHKNTILRRMLPFVK